MNKKVWLITGCSTGFGRALAEKAIGRGDSVVATARDPRQLQELASAENCRVIGLDVTRPEDAEASVRQTVEAFGRLDVLVNNAGYGLVGAFEELSEEQIRRCFETNFFGALSVTRAALPQLRAQGAGHIVNISAAAVISNYAGFSIYGASKWALEGVSESLAAELKPLGIRVTIVRPGPFRTDFIGRSMERANSSLPEYERTSGKFLKFLEGVDGKQPGDPARAADAILQTVDSENPPLRLVLGKYANDKAHRANAASERELSAWESVGLPTDFA